MPEEHEDKIKDETNMPKFGTKEHENPMQGFSYETHMNLRFTKGNENTQKGFSCERTLMEKVAEGDWAACETLVKQYTNAIYRFLVRSLGSHADAEDILQETFLRAFKHAKSFDPRYSISTWFFTIARRLAINASQARSRRIHLFAETLQHAGDDARETDIHTDVPETGPTPEEQLSKKELGAQLQDAIANLPERQRTALLLTYYEGLSYQEVSRVMGTSLSSVESAIYRAKQTLAKMLEK